MTNVDSRTVRQARLTYVDRGTPMGEYQRRFWHPIAATIEFEKWPVKKVRLLGEDLALFRTENGTIGLVGDRCPHRGASLSCAMTDGDGIRCAYHGWLYDTSGQCVDTPTEPETSRLK
ncbi:MAG TPA: Rieske 2Fe-2S domain-containing protein, partial [Candidatus Acidoferrum sp.]|nr:Rieske 2Fe-2S domain-containing protein [Candidatus Acidoferrum sp.]